MRISGVGLDDFTQITGHVSRLYDGNLTVCEGAHELPYARRPQCVARLAVVKSAGSGARRSWTGRRMPCACWHAYRDVLSAVFDAFPDAVIRTSMQGFGKNAICPFRPIDHQPGRDRRTRRFGGRRRLACAGQTGHKENLPGPCTSMAVYRGHAGFTEAYPETAYQNIGSELYPVTMPELCECDDRTPTAGDDLMWAGRSYAGPDFSYSEEYIQDVIRHADETLRRVPA